MSIASELDSTIENLKSDYEGLENIGADLTNIDKNIYNIRTCLDNIYTNLPKTTGEGSNLSLTTLKGRINVEAVKGDTEQDTYEGYNLLPLDEIAETTTNGITYSVKNGILKLNGTATAPSTIYLKTNGITLASGTYSYCGIIQSGTETGVIGKYLRNSGGNVYDGGRIESLQTRTIESYENLSATIYISSGVVCSNFVIGLMLLSGTYSSSNLPSFEPYTNGASPNPSYPQDINVVTGTQEVVVQNKNLANVNETQIGKAWNNASNNARAILVLPIEHNTQYTISYGNLGSIEGIYYGYRTDEATAGGGVSQMSTNPTTITTNDTNNYIIFQFNKTSISLADIQALNLQLEKGSTKTDFVEHQEQTKTLHLSSSNLCNLNFNSSTIAGVTLTKNNDNTITANGTATSTIAVNILNNNGGISTDNLILPKGTYTLSGCPTRWWK